LKVNLINIRTQDEQTDAHSSNGTTQVALGYQRIDPSLTDPNLSPLSSPQTHILPSKQRRQIDLRKLKSSRVRAFCRVARPSSTSTSWDNPLWSLGTIRPKSGKSMGQNGTFPD